VRRNCSKCKAEYAPVREKLPRDFQLADDLMLMRGSGCPNCRNTGFRGRTGLYELMLMNDRISQMIIDRAPLHEIVATGRQNGLRLLREDGWTKVRGGMTTVEEVLTCTAV
jgi:general secretion pathway protein E/type IV pilus assembly protein PilB